MPPTSTYTEAELVHLLRQRADNGFNYLYHHYSAALLTVIRNFVPHSPEVAEELLQEVYIRVFRKIDLYDANKSRLYTWMAQIARNLCIDELRKQKMVAGSKNQLTESDVDELVATPAANPDRIGMAALLTRLPAGEKDALTLAYMQGHTQQEISELLAVPLGTVKSRMRNGLKKLRELIGER